MIPAIAMALDPGLSGIVAAAALAVDGVVVRDRHAALDAPLHAAAERMRAVPDAPEVTAAVRTMYKRVGLDPTKTRPSSEALARRVRRGDDLPRINSLVDVVNWCSLESRLPFGLYDADRIEGDVVLRLGRAGEEYAGIRKDVVHLAGRMTLVDARGPFGNPTSDSLRTMVTPAARRALVVVFAPATMADAGDAALAIARARIVEYCS
jgi:DNA/RNA-binding domain of Phe-tRNA-synthetase-like protein